MTSLLDNLSGLLKDATAGKVPETELHHAYDQVVDTVPASTLATGLTHAFNADETPPFEQMLATLFNGSTPAQKAGILNRIVASLGPAAVAQILGSSNVAGALTGGAVTPQQAQQIPPATIQILAQNAAKKDPTIVDAAAGFYAEHPTIVKAIGAGALAFLLSKMSKRR